MKRVKIMLISLLVLATVGGILAFKAKESAICLYYKIVNTCPLTTATFPESVTVIGSGTFSYANAYPNCPADQPFEKCTLDLTWFEAEN